MDGPPSDKKQKKWKSEPEHPAYSSTRGLSWVPIDCQPRISEDPRVLEDPILFGTSAYFEADIEIARDRTPCGLQLTLMPPRTFRQEDKQPPPQESQSHPRTPPAQAVKWVLLKKGIGPLKWASNYTNTNEEGVHQFAQHSNGHCTRLRDGNKSNWREVGSACRSLLSPEPSKRGPKAPQRTPKVVLLVVSLEHQPKKALENTNTETHTETHMLPVSSLRPPQHPWCAGIFGQSPLSVRPSGRSLDAMCLSPLTNMSSSDRCSLKPAGDNKTYS